MEKTGVVKNNGGGAASVTELRRELDTLVKDPIVVSTEHTYASQFIQAYIDARRYRKCTNTQELLSQTNLVPNNLSEEIISQSLTNAAAALFPLSHLDSNKFIIGSNGELKPPPLAMKDAASAISNLCISQENRVKAVNAGAIKVILQKIEESNHVDEMLSTLDVLSRQEDAVDEMGALGAVPILLGFLKENRSPSSKENSIAILHSICLNDPSKMREIRDEEFKNATIEILSQTGTSRAQRKAIGILERLKQQQQE